MTSDNNPTVIIIDGESVTLAPRQKDGGLALAMMERLDAARHRRVRVSELCPFGHDAQWRDPDNQIIVCTECPPYEAHFTNAISSRGWEIHRFHDLTEARQLAATHYPWNNTRIEIVRVLGRTPNGCRLVLSVARNAGGDRW